MDAGISVSASAILQYDATGEKSFLELGRKKTVEVMAPHVSHTGVHDHGFNNVSTYGNLLRLMHEGKTAFNEWEKKFLRSRIKNFRCSAGKPLDNYQGRWFYSLF
jgi:hypothetical protein